MHNRASTPKSDSCVSCSNLLHHDAQGDGGDVHHRSHRRKLVLGSKPVAVLDSKPVAVLDSKPVAVLGSRPVAVLGSRPVAVLDSRPVRERNPAGDDADDQLGRQVPAWR